MKIDGKTFTSSNFRWEKGILATSLIAFILGVSFVRVPESAAQGNAPAIWEVQTLESDESGLSNPVGLAFSVRGNAFQVLEGRGASETADIVKVNPFGERAAVAQIAAAVQDPINMAYDNRVGRLLLLGAAGNQLVEVREGTDGNLDLQSIVRHNISGWGLQAPQGMTVDDSGVLLILDAAGPRLVRVEPGAGGDLETALVSEIPLSLGSPRGIAFDPLTGNFHIVVPAEQKLYELSQAGEVLTSRDLSQVELLNPQGIVFAPSGDQTDDPAQQSLFVADGANPQGSGEIVELSLVQPAALPAGTTLLPASLLRTFATSTWSNPSPDPGGIDYFPATGRFLITDSEIEESVDGHPPAYWNRYNVFFSTLSGGLVGNCTTYTSGSVGLVYNNFSNEPTGVAINAAKNHVFFTNDGSNGRLFEVKPGPDGNYCGSDDIVTRRNVANQYGATDAEDVAYGNNTVFVADGVNAEVWVIPLGNDGIMSDDDGPVTHWDTAAMGFHDLEGIGYNQDNGSLFIVSTTGSENYLGETSPSGELLRVYDLSFMGTQKNIRSDVVYAPSSQNQSARSIYIASRGVDNNTNRLENDGKIWEIALSGVSGPTPTPTSTSTPTPSPTPTSPPSGTDLIFADGFESGNLSAWSSSVVDGGDLSVSSAAALVGSQGLRAVIDDSVAIYVTDDRPNAEPRYRARFYFDPNSIPMVNSDAHIIFYGYTGTSTAVLRGQFRFYNAAYQVRFGLLNDSGTWLDSSWLGISDAPHFLEVDWRAATAAGANDGGLTFWIDGTQRANLTGNDNDTRRIDRVVLGPRSGLDTGTRGTYFFDGFESRRQTYIGP